MWILDTAERDSARDLHPDEVPEVTSSLRRLYFASVSIRNGKVVLNCFFVPPVVVTNVRIPSVKPIWLSVKKSKVPSGA